MSWLDVLDQVVTFVIYRDRKQVGQNLFDQNFSKTSDLTLWNYEADMKSNENETSVKIRPKPKKNIYMDVSYLSEIRSLTNITEKASRHYNTYFVLYFQSLILAGHLILFLQLFKEIKELISEVSRLDHAITQESQARKDIETKYAYLLEK